MSLDDLELELRRMPGVLSVGFAETEGLVVVELQAGPDAADDLARSATMLAINHLGNPTAVEVDNPVMALSAAERLMHREDVGGLTVLRRTGEFDRLALPGETQP